MKIIGEIGINHNGDLTTAFKLMCMAKKAGADYVKFQKRTIETVYTKEFLDSPRESPWGNTQRAQKQALEFDREGYDSINRYSQEIGLPWFGSAWDLDSLGFLESYNPPLHKIASPMITHKEFVKAVAGLKRKTLVSCGASTWENIDYVMDVFKETNTEIVLMHCVSEYPCPDEHVNLGMIYSLKERYPGAEIGYSNHSAGIESCVGAAYLGAQYIELHITCDRSSYGSDQAASIEKRGLELVVKYCKNSHKIIGDGIRIIREVERQNAKKLRYWES